MPPFCEVFAPVFLRAMATIVVAEISMSLDNVLGVAGAAHDNTAMLVFGLALSIVLMAVGANMLARFLDRYQWISYIGLAVIFGSPRRCRITASLKYRCISTA